MKARWWALVVILMASMAEAANPPVLKEGKLVLLGTVKLDPAKDPKAADWTMTVDGKEQVAHGIYEVDGDTFKHCYSREDRPTRFESKEDSKVTYAVFKRVKK